jgi:hypothetical protein
VGKLIAEALRLIPSWETLRKLTLWRWPENDDPAFNGASGILTWPGLRCLQFRNVSISSMSDLVLLPGAGVTDLASLDDSSIAPSARNAVISTCRVLEAFEFQDADPSSRNNREEIMPPQDLVAELAVHKSTLQSLTLDFQNFHHYRKDYLHQLQGYEEEDLYIISLQNSPL